MIQANLLNADTAKKDIKGTSWPGQHSTLQSRRYYRRNKRRMMSLTPNELPKIQKAIIKSITRLRLPGEQQQTHPLRQQTLFLPAYERCPPQTH